MNQLSNYRPNYHLTFDADKKNTFDIEKFLSRKPTLHSKDQYTVVKPDEAN